MSDQPAVPDAVIEPPEAPEAPAYDIRGLVDNVTDTHVFGWVFNRLVPGQRLNVELLLGERCLGRTVANVLRADLKPNGIGDGRHAFEFVISPDDMTHITKCEVLARAGDGPPFPLPIRLQNQPIPPRPARPAAPPPPKEAAPGPAPAPRPAKPAAPAVTPVTTAQFEQLKAEVQALSQQVATLTSGDLARSLEQHAAMVQRLANLELWMSRVDERLAEAHAPAAVPPAGVDRWQLVLFGFLIGTLVVGVGVSAILSW